MTEIEKSQVVRLIDVFVIAPILIYTGVRYYKELPKILAILIIVIGIATLIYNGNNYFKKYTQ